jgi:hypothetical protein
VAPASPKLAGFRCDTSGVGGRDPSRSRGASDGRPLCCGTAGANLALTDRIATLYPPHSDADVGRTCRLPYLHLYLCHARSEEPAGGTDPDSPPRCAAIGSNPRLSLLHGGLFRLALSRQHPRTRAGRHLRYLHEPSLEHGIQLLSIAPDHSDRSRRSELKFSYLGLAAFLASRSPFRHARPHLEHDDVDVRRVVLCCGLRSNLGR